MSRWIGIALTAVVAASCAPPTPTKAPDTKEYVQVTDSNGKVISEGWETNRAPDRYERDGLDQVTPYVEKLLASQKRFTTVDLMTLHESRIISIWKMEGVVTIGLMFNNPGEAAMEKKARSFFKQRGISPSEDYLASNGGVADATRILDWPVKGSAQEIADLAGLLAVDVLRIPRDAGMQIEFQEHKDQQGKYEGEDSFTIRIGTVKP